ncbi:MAG: XdhC family protein [Acidobacteria bacterium]|jgi:xanthine dehydrogenase accessory factor|nr:XdhC family protein [Acidobacteriota bacterium]
MLDVITATAEAITRGERVALVTIVRVNGSTPQRLGAKMLVAAGGDVVGTIGGGCYENDAIGRARLALREQSRPFLVHYDLNDDFAQDSGLVCGGQMDVFIEPLLPAPDLFIVGAGHVGFHLGRMAAATGFTVHVIDDREAFANRERFPDAADVIVDEVGAWLAEAPLPPGSYVVVVTRGHRHDLEAVRALATRDVRYVGLIGSRAKVARLGEQLALEGGDPTLLARVHAPIGIDIGAVTPEEIAVSILAELIAVRYGRIRYKADGTPDDTANALRWTPPVTQTSRS